MEFRFAKVADVETLARLNAQLILDEQHRSQLTHDELKSRMKAWLDGPYKGVIFEDLTEVCGYALYRFAEDHVYLRQFLIERSCRRQGRGRTAIEWLWKNAWPATERLRVDVLVTNEIGIAFWKSVGFEEYCLTMEVQRRGSSFA